MLIDNKSPGQALQHDERIRKSDSLQHPTASALPRTPSVRDISQVFELGSALTLKTRPSAKRSWKIRPKIFWQNNDQCTHFKAAADSKPMSLLWMRWKSQADIAGDQPIPLTMFILLINELLIIYKFGRVYSQIGFVKHVQGICIADNCGAALARSCLLL